jgi:predicted aspartyl protease
MSSAGTAILPLIAAFLVPTAHGSSGAQDAGNVDVVETQDDWHERLTVPVRIGEHGPYRFLLDTGSQNTIVSTALADKLALPAGERATIVGIAGSQDVDTVELDEIMLGKRSYFGLLAPLLDRRHIGADGILGLDGLQDQRVLFDFDRNLIAVDDAKALGGNRGYDIVVKARRRSGQLVLTNARIDGVRADVVIDTGAQVSIGNRALQRALMRRRAAQQQVTINSVTGQSLPADVALAREFMLGNLVLENVAILYADAPPFESLNLHKKPALLLGMRELRSFKRVAIDFESRKILFDLPRN